jgi:hypothetical protein
VKIKSRKFYFVVNLGIFKCVTFSEDYPNPTFRVTQLITLGSKNGTELEVQRGINLYTLINFSNNRCEINQLGIRIGLSQVKKLVHVLI